MMLALYTIGSLLVLLLTEQLYPAERDQPLRNTLFNLIWYPIIAAAGVLISYLSMGALTTWLVEQTGGPLIVLSEPTSAAEHGLYFFLFLVVWDFFNYWFHRLQHHSDWVWPCHKLHHSDQSVNVTTSFRVHWTHHFFVNFLLTLPMAFFVNLSPALAGWPFAIYLGALIFTHMNIRLSFG